MKDICLDNFLDDEAPLLSPWYEFCESRNGVEDTMLLIFVDENFLFCRIYLLK